MTLDPRDTVPCECGHLQSITRGTWSAFGAELLDATGAHRPVLKCAPLAHLDRETATLCLRLAGVEAV